MKEYKNYSLLQHNTFGIDAKCRRFLEYESVEEAQQIAAFLNDDDQPLLILGGGSNLLLTGDYPATVVHSAIKGIEIIRNSEYLNCNDGRLNDNLALGTKKSTLVKCGSGVVFDDFIAWAVEHQLYGVENLSLIPGEVGASAVQNIGAYGAEAKDVIFEIEAVELATGKVKIFRNEECEYAYRQSKFKQEWKDKFLITHVTYLLNNTFSPKLDYGNIRSSLEEKFQLAGESFDVAKLTAKVLRDVIIEIRKEKLPEPTEFGNAGSFFMNPIIEEKTFLGLKNKFPNLRYFEVSDGNVLRYKIPAGWMIDQCGWKGKNLGKAGVWPKQALVLYNVGGAKGEEVVALCNAIRKDVKEKFGLDIYPEVNIK